MNSKVSVSKIYQLLLSEKAKHKFEKIIFVLALLGFFLHLAMIGLIHWGVLSHDNFIAGKGNPIDAIYTPFSIILFYEVYCLIYYLPKSITIYIGKQYEIIALIMIRNMFDAISKLNLTSDLNTLQHNTLLFYSMLSILLLFGLIYLYYRLNQRKISQSNETDFAMQTLPSNIQRYIFAKKIVTFAIAIAFICLVCINTINWFSLSDSSLYQFIVASKVVNQAMFAQFFTILILSDVVMLLLTLMVNDEFHVVIRNSGFVISTTLLKLSFGVTGIVNYVFVISGVLFGVLVLAIYRLYRKIELPENR